MGESAACLVRSFSHSSPTSSEEKKGNHIQRALTSSVSFGRFVSESLDWERWSAFTQNRYLEEAEKYSKPGSVAEKKAYFEAHFKRRRAAALLEQQNAAASNLSETGMKHNVDVNSSIDLGFLQRENYMVTENMKEGGEVRSSDPAVAIDQNGKCDASVEGTLEHARPGGVEEVTEQLVLKENPVELMNHLENDGCIGDIVSKKDDKACDKDDSALRNSASSEKSSEVYSSKLLKNGSASKCSPSVKPKTPVQLRKSEKSPESKNNKMGSSNKRRSCKASLHMSINFASCSGATQKGAYVGLPKIESSTIVRAPVKKYKNNMLPQTSTRASTTGLFKHQLPTPPAENRRTMRPHGDSISGARAADERVLSPSSNYSRSSNLFGAKARIPTVSSSFTFKSEERAVKRREFFQKLEQKSKSKETEKHQAHAKPQVKTRITDKDLCDPIVLKTAKTADVPSKNLNKKIQPPRPPCFPKIEERAVFKVQDNDSRPPWRFSVKTEELKDFSGKNSLLPKCLTKKSLGENASPNIQL